MIHQDENTRHHLAELRVDLEARAAGYWWVAGERLEQIAVAASPALAEEVVLGFLEATRSVAMSEADLGIVRAATAGTMAVSRVSELPADSGSGRWLRAFEATRSVAVPLHDLKGAIRAVVSVALADSPLDDEAVAERIHEAVKGWAPLV